MPVVEQPSEGVSLRDGDTSLAIPTAFRQDSFISTDIRSNNVFTSINRFPSTRHGSGSADESASSSLSPGMAMFNQSIPTDSAENRYLVPTSKNDGEFTTRKRQLNRLYLATLSHRQPGVALGSVVTGACVTGRKPSHHRG
ncbi:hypothetical protein MJO29_008432 [Puccinia striiformis f. sp. tritici]|uniref:Uncharacterized protein n=1 Tax=Puccinia striiformis TaxID=27350 RepID=A0A2S4UTB6_9BASI|nr:hypothetical protein MJO29_008432 [Puccinia striiformis f. sp. tritici]POW00365.1 hypothetical protein PSTT_13195 [Puccinia striiformis]